VRLASNTINHKTRTTESLKQYEEGQAPWNKVGIDLFEIKGRDYVATVDYLSGS
jgi:hypothetical protein